jgi:nitrous oxidase accessory protein NosD
MATNAGLGRAWVRIWQRPGRIAAGMAVGIGALALGAFAAAPAGASSGGATGAVAGTLTCGMDLTHSVTLTANVTFRGCTSTEAVYIDADTVTVNLNGHTVTGPWPHHDTYGFYNDGYSDFTIEHGSIKTFEYAVLEYSSDHPVVSKLTISAIGGDDETDAIYLTGDQYTAVVSGNTISQSEYAIYCDYCPDSVISGNSIKTAYYAILRYEGTGSVIKQNVMHSDTYGIYVEDDPYMTITGNSITRSYAAIIAYYGDYSNFSNNVANNSDYGIYSYESYRSTWKDNTTNNDSYGFWSYYTDDVTFVDNTAKYDTIGMLLEYPDYVFVRSLVANDNRTSGLFVLGRDYADPTAATIAHSTAEYNKYGLYATTPVDGFTNTAIHNSVTNCYNVGDCTPLVTPAAPSIAAPAPPHPASVPPAVATREQ